MPSALAHHWQLDPEVAFLNHGSFGATPTAVLQVQRAWQERMERQPCAFFARDLEGLLDVARARLATFVGAPAEELAFLPNATAGVNAFVRSMRFGPGDELLATSHGYNACNNVLRHVAERDGAKVVFAPLPFPVRDEAELDAAFFGAITERTRFALIDHVTSPTGLVLPVERWVKALEARGITVMVDGAHAPGMLALDLKTLGATAYAGNLHKWVCAPKGAAFLHVRRDAPVTLVPHVVSHGANSTRTDRPRLHLEFDWTGTDDPSPFLAIPAALDFLASLFPDGLAGYRRALNEMLLRERDRLCAHLGIEKPAPDALLGALAAVPLPPDPSIPAGAFLDPLQLTLIQKHRVETFLNVWPAAPNRVLRLSAQVYLDASDFDRLYAALAAEGLGR